MGKVQIEGPQGLMGKEEEVTIIAQNGWLVTSIRLLTVLFYFMHREISQPSWLGKTSSMHIAQSKQYKWVQMKQQSLSIQ